MKLSGKVAIVTGAGGGIGRAIAKELAGKGAQVLAADLDPETSKRTAKAIEDSMGQACWAQVDVASYQSECWRVLRKAMSDADSGLVFDAGNLTVGEYVERWLEDSAKGDLAPRTYANYKLQIRQHISPAFGRLKLSKLTAAHVQDQYAGKLRDGLKPSSVRYIHAVLHRALEQAVRFNLVALNPAAKVDPPKVRLEEITPLDTEQARRFLDTASEASERYEALFVLSLTTGLRMGEALGLKWSDIDLDKGTLRVNRQLQRLRRDGDKSSTLVFSEPKNASRRTVDLPQRAVEALRSHRKRQAEERLGRAPTRTQDSFSPQAKALPSTLKTSSTAISSLC